MRDLEPVEMTAFVMPEHASSGSWMRAKAVGDGLLAALNSPPVLARIHAANQPGNSSEEIQRAFSAEAERLGFQSEKAGLFQGQSLRPDYFLELGAGEGILLEVERGKTTINNMDLLDFWKCHLCPGANYLFLLVPRRLRQNAEMRPRNEYVTVGRRLGQFFEPGNGTNVRGLCLFGY